MACWTVVIFSASSSGISISNSSSRAITSSTVSRESAPRSSTNEASFTTCSALTPNCSATIALTCCSTVLIADSPSIEMFVRPASGGPAAGAYSRATLPRPPRCQIVSACFCLFFGGLAVAIGQRKCPSNGTFACQSGHVHAAIDVESLSGDVPGARPTEEQNGGRDVVDASEPPHRHLRGERGALLFVQRSSHVGID